MHVLGISRIPDRIFSSIVFLVVAFLFPFRARFFKHSRDTAVNEESRLPPFFLVLLLYRFLDASLDFDLFRKNRRGTHTTRLFGHRLLIALGLFRRKLPIRHVNSDVCVYSDPIFSSSGQWSRNALMQIVAIAPRRTGLPRMKALQARFNPLALSLCHISPCLSHLSRFASSPLRNSPSRSLYSFPSLFQNWFAPGSRATGVNHRENLIALVSRHALFFIFGVICQLENQEELKR